MKLKTTKLLCAMLTLTILVGLIPILHNVAAQARPRLYVDPAENTFFTDETQVGATFTVTIRSADFGAPGVFSYQLKLMFDATMLEATAAAIPDGHWLTPANAANIFKVDPGTIDNAAGFASFGVTLLGTEAGKIGGGVIATVTLKILAAPPAGGSLTSSINLGVAGTDTILVDPSATEIPANTYDIVPATYTYGSPPPPWYLKITPDVVAASTIGDAVKINVDFLNAKATGRIVGVEFRVTYPEILIVSTEDIVEGPFFKSFGNTFFQGYNDTRDAEGRLSVLAFIFLVPGDDGQWATFPEGNGTLATITFKVMALPTSMTAFPITLTDVQIIDADSNIVPYRKLEDATLVAPSKPEDLNGDGKVNIQDITIWALAFGATPDVPRWNAKADVNRDGKINIIDAALIAKSFGFIA